MANSDPLHDKLIQIVGDMGILSDVQNSGYAIDGIPPKAVVMPASVLEMQEVLRLASKENLPVIPAGSGTKLGIGNLASKIGLVLSTTRLNKVIEYEPADLTVTVEAGIRLAELQKKLSVNRQFLPLNPPYADRCTIGGIVSTNSSGPLRLQYGTARNLVLGMKVVLASGTTVKSGGKVVKNVAGYDLNRLYIGSYGTLGIITEVSLKLSPLPSHEKILAAHFDTIKDAVNAGLVVVCSQVLPSFANLLTKSSVNESRENPTLLVGFTGDPDTISWQLDTTQLLLEQNGSNSVQILEEDTQDCICQEMQEYSAVDKDNITIIVKVHLKRSDIAEFSTVVQNITSDIMILLGNGVLYMRIPFDSDVDLQSLADSLAQLRQQVMDVKGNLIIEAAPKEFKRLFDIWGPIGDTLNLMKQLKTKFDSKSLLNPGRYVSNI